MAAGYEAPLLGNQSRDEFSGGKATRNSGAQCPQAPQRWVTCFCLHSLLMQLQGKQEAEGGGPDSTVLLERRGQQDDRGAMTEGARIKKNRFKKKSKAFKNRLKE